MSELNVHRAIDSTASVISETTQSQRRWTVIVGVVSIAIFGALLNPYWSRGGDSDVYLSIARNLYHHKGFTFNNNPVSVIPPLWTWVLAGALHISSSFLFLKLIPMLSMAGTMIIWHRIALRYLDAKWSAIAMMLTAGLSQTFLLSMWFHSEGFYCLIASIPVLLALQINEKKPFAWRAVLILILMSAACLTRFAGLLWWAVLAAALLRNEWPRFNRQTILAAISLALVLATFVVMRREMKVDRSQLNFDFDTSMAGTQYFEDIAPDNTWTDYRDRVIGVGNWFGGLFWQAAREFKPLRIPSLLTGWVVLVVLAYRTVLDLRKKDWLLAAGLAQALLLCLTWPSPVARYLVPLAPLFMLGMIRAGLSPFVAGKPKDSDQPPLIIPLVWPLRVFITTVISCNFFTFAMEFWISHRSDYYANYQAGLNDDLINIARYIDDHDVPEGKIAINRADANGNRARISNGWLRAFIVLTDRPVRNLPQEMEGDKDAPTIYKPDDPKVIDWLEKEGITHYLYRGASNTMWHFRTGKNKDAGEWELYEIKNGKAVKIDPPEVDDWPKSLPET